MTCLIEPFGPSTQPAAAGCAAPGAALAAAPALTAAAVTPSVRATAAGTANVLEKPLLPSIRPPPIGIRHGRVIAAHPLWGGRAQRRPYPEKAKHQRETFRGTQDGELVNLTSSAGK